MNKYMAIALDEAKKAFELGEVPIGAVIVKDNKVVSKAHNKRETLKLATAHAEILVIEEACKKLDTWRLDGCTIYITILPCVMCAGAIVNSRISKVIYGAKEEKFGYVDDIERILSSSKLNHRAEVVGGVMEDEARDLMKKFFKGLR